MVLPGSSPSYPSAAAMLRPIPSDVSDLLETPNYSLTPRYEVQSYRTEQFQRKTISALRRRRAAGTSERLQADNGLVAPSLCPR